MNRDVNFVITDLDDTIWDWLDMWHKSFDPYITRIAFETGIDVMKLKKEFKQLHQKYGTTEVSFAYKEIPSISEEFYPLFEELKDGKKNILHEYNSNKKNSLKAYDGVIDTLRYIKSKGTRIVAFTESNVFFTKYRIKHLNLDGIIDDIYSPLGHDIPGSVSKYYSDDFWEPKITRIRTLPTNTRKPNAEILETIIKDFKADKAHSIYIGDKLDRDIFMAQQAGITSVYAEYGHVIDGSKYSLLVDVTHWTDEDVSRERKFKEKKLDIKPPDFTIHSFAQIKDIFKFKNFNNDARGN
jgi:phosphoglycolate phosphatase-like HAD superfamily hydrolase